LDAELTGGVAVTDRRAFVGTDAAEVVALDRSDGSVAWRAATRGPVRATPAVAGDASSRTVYATDHDGTLSAFAAADGSVRFRHDVGRWPDAPPAVGHSAVFVADQTGRVSAVVGE
jgi:outer membrane protein assembly factor BamB